MANLRLEVIQSLKNTAHSLEKNPDYQWGHMGSCNCGHLVQEITKFNKAEIHTRAMAKCGDWNEQLNDYCPTSGLLMDDLITQMLDFGFSTDDLKHLENLSDPEILRTLPHNKSSLQRNKKEDVILYLLSWASHLEEQLLDQVDLPELTCKERLTAY